MAYTYREQILRAVETAIGTGYPSELKQAPTRCRFQPYEDAELPAINWYPLAEAAERSLSPGMPIQRRRLTVQFDIHVTNPPASTAYPAIDGRADLELAFLTKQLGGSRLSGLAHDVVETETRWNFDESTRDRAVISMQFEITYHTKTTSQEAQ